MATLADFHLIPDGGDITSNISMTSTQVFHANNSSDTIKASFLDHKVTDGSHFSGEYL